MPINPTLYRFVSHNIRQSRNANAKHRPLGLSENPWTYRLVKDSGKLQLPIRYRTLGSTVTTRNKKQMLRTQHPGDRSKPQIQLSVSMTVFQCKSLRSSFPIDSNKHRSVHPRNYTAFLICGHQNTFLVFYFNTELQHEIQ